MRGRALAQLARRDSDTAGADHLSTEVDSRSSELAPPMSGRFSGNGGLFYDEDMFEGRPGGHTRM
jgi:hypothetical protein